MYNMTEQRKSFSEVNSALPGIGTSESKNNDDGDDVFVNQSRGIDESSSNDHNRPELNLDMLNVYETRLRSNSEVNRVEANIPESDIIGEPAPQIRENALPPLTTFIDHDRGEFVMQTIETDIYPSDEYDKQSKEPGEVFIFNFETFFHERARQGTRLDVKALIETLGQLKLNIPKERIFNDLTKEKLLAAIKTATATFDASKQKINCLIVVFLTHGLANNVIATKDDHITVEEIVHEFCACDALEGVPKWFTFLACKEPKRSYRVNLEKDEDLKLVSDETYIRRLPDDVILYYSTSENNKSARHALEGTWVIHELCNALNAYGRRDEIFAILTRTNKAVVNNYIGNDPDSDSKKYFRQCPVILSTLRKKFYITLSKDRIAQMEILNKLQNTSKIIQTKTNPTF